MGPIYTIPEFIKNIESSPSVKGLILDFYPVVEQAISIFPWVHILKEWYIYYSKETDYIKLEGSMGGLSKLIVIMTEPKTITVEFTIPPEKNEIVSRTVFRRRVETDPINLIGVFSSVANHLTNYMETTINRFSSWNVVPDTGIFIKDAVTNKEYFIPTNRVVWLPPSNNTIYVTRGYRTSQNPIPQPFWIHPPKQGNIFDQDGLKLKKCRLEVVSLLEIEECEDEDRL